MWGACAARKRKVFEGKDHTDRGQGRAWAHSCERVSEQVDPNECAPRTGSRVRGSAHPRRPSPVLRRPHAPDVPPDRCALRRGSLRPPPGESASSPLHVVRRARPAHKHPASLGSALGPGELQSPRSLATPHSDGRGPPIVWKVSRQGTRVANGANARGVVAINLSGYKPKNLLICEANKNI